jgi:hypothetical protein
MFFFQYLVQAGLFFVVPLYLSVCLGLSALATGARLLPLSVTLLAPRSGSRASAERLAAARRPRRAARAARGTVVLLAALDPTRGRRSSSCRCS